MLMVSNKLNEAGIGNQYGVVGKHFSDHPYLSNLGVMVVTKPSLNLGLYQKNLNVNGIKIGVHLELSKEAKEQGKLLTSRIHFHEIEWHKYLIDRGKPRKNKTWSDRVSKKIRWVLEDLYNSKKKAVNAPQNYGEARSARLFSYGAWTEVIPRKDSRIYLDHERDKLGLQKVVLDWKIGQEEKQSLIKSLHYLGKQFGLNGIGRIRVDLDESSPWPWEGGYEPGLHQMGTTRMSADPVNGVVDKDCKVHGIANLYIAGSSIFPTYGTANPTLTIVALAIRLADVIKGKSS
jgi:choline dehydrogenase-like flavoprotein